MNTQGFGSFWTTTKLEVIEQYLDFYTTVLKKQNFKLCYIDGFAGSGTVKIKSGETIDGSAVRALKYSFDAFRFFERDKHHYSLLNEKIKQDYQKKEKIINLYNDDCNKFLAEIDRFDWVKHHWRGVIFLDPYAMQLSWECLEKIRNTKVFDVWYLFPFSAVNRNLNKDGQIPEANRKTLNKVLGSDSWESIIYQESPQMNLFGDSVLEKQNVDVVRQYILARLRETFPTVSPNAALLRNEQNSPMFLLCFVGSNPSSTARNLSLKAADHILSKIN